MASPPEVVLGRVPDLASRHPASLGSFCFWPAAKIYPDRGLIPGWLVTLLQRGRVKNQQYFLLDTLPHAENPVAHQDEFSSGK